MSDARRATDATWFRVLERFGLPTLLVLLLLGYEFRRGEQDRKERSELLAGLQQAIQNNTAAMVSLAREERDHADAVRATWPRMRPPRYVASHDSPASSGSEEP